MALLYICDVCAECKRRCSDPFGYFGSGGGCAVMNEDNWTFGRCVTSDFSQGQLDCCSVVTADESGVALGLPASLYPYVGNNKERKLQ